MEAIIAAQQAEAQNATTLILAAINTGLISIEDANNLSAEYIEEIGSMETPEEVGIYVFRRLHEMPEQRDARLAQQRVALQQVIQAARTEIQARADERANTMNNPGQPMGGSRRKRSRKSRKHRR